MNGNNTKAMELWTSKWTPETHTTKYAKKRIKSAQSAKLTPVKIDAEDMYGYFQGSSGRYETFLDYCPCGDFHRSKLPCKHIYRLAIELGLMDISVSHDNNAIPTPTVERVRLSDTIDIVECLSENAQQKLLDISSGLNSEKPICHVDFDNDVSELLQSGIIIEAEPQKHFIKFGKKAEIIEFLNNENFVYDEKLKKNELEELCQTYLPEKAEARFGFSLYVSIPTKFSAQNIHYYLHRKYDYDYDDNFKKIQLLDTELPNDAITRELITRGLYSPNTPKVRINNCTDTEIELKIIF